MERSCDAVLPPVRAVRFTVEGRTLVVVAERDATDSISRAIERRDPSIFAEFRDVARFIPPGSTVLDVGAHVGVASIYYASRGHRVVSFEASAANATLLRQARAANDSASWEIVEAAVSDRARTVPFLSSGPEGHILAEGTPAGDGVAAVEAIALDAWLEREPGYEPIGLIKMDIEGAEILALAGARGLLSRPTRRHCSSSRTAIVCTGSERRRRRCAARSPASDMRSSACARAGRCARRAFSPSHPIRYRAAAW